MAGSLFLFYENRGFRNIEGFCIDKKFSSILGAGVISENHFVVYTWQSL